MFALKKKYFLIIESIKDINLKNIKKYNKFIIIYRNQDIQEDINDLKKFRKECKLKFIDFFVANDIKLSVLLNSDGIYLSSYNKSFKALSLKNSKFKIIGSAHNVNEINFKIKQGCRYILLSKLFLVGYARKEKFLGIIKFNAYSNKFLTKVNCKSFALLSEIKKKPANIINRLF